MAYEFSKSDMNRIRLEFVLRVINKKHTRPVLRYLSIEDDWAIGTDGNRIHYSFISQTLPDGLYQPTRKGAMLYLNPVDPATMQGLKYPKWRTKLPDTSAMQKTKWVATFESDKTSTIDIYKFWRVSGCCIDFSFLKDLAVKGVSYDCYWKDAISPVLFGGRQGVGMGAVISPITEKDGAGKQYPLEVT